MGIMMGIVSFVLGFAINLIDAAVSGMLESIGYDMSTFLAVFPFARNAMDTFTACGLFILMAGLAWQFVKGIAAPFGVEYENPLHVVGKVVFTWIAVVNLADILDIFTGFFRIVQEDMNNQSLGSGFDMEGFASNMLSGLISSLTGMSGLLLVVYIICVIILGWKFIKLLIEMVERYIVYCFICLIGPAFLSTAAFKSTSNIAGTWMRAFWGHSLLILINTWSAKMFLSYCQVFTQNIAGIQADGVFIPTLTMLFFGFAFLDFASRADTLIRILGLNTAHTGANLMQGAMGGLSRMVSSARSLQSVGGAIRGAAAAGAAAGGMGTAAGMKAAVSSFASGVTGGAAHTATGVSSVAGEATNRRNDGSKVNPGEPGRRAGADTPLRSGDLLRQESTPSAQVLNGQKEINDALTHKSNPHAENGIGGTNGIRGVAAKMDYTDGGVMASAGRQSEMADKNHGSGKAMGMIYQDTMTANAVRAAATGAERFVDEKGQSRPIASYKGAEAATAMNGVTAFGNDNLKGFNFTEAEDGTSFISGQNFRDGSSVTYDSVEGGIASGVYTDADGNSTAFELVHDNVVESQRKAVESGAPGVTAFNPRASVGRIGDGTGESGFYVVPKTISENQLDTKPFGHTKTYGEMGASVNQSDPVQMQQATQSLQQFIGNSNPVDHAVLTIDKGKLERMQSDAQTGVPRTRQQAGNGMKQ